MTLAARFDLGRPLPLHFLRRASKAGGVDAATHTLAKYIVELSLGVYSLCHIPPSKLSAAALALAMRLLEPGATLATLWGPSLHHYTRCVMDQLHQPPPPHQVHHGPALPRGGAARRGALHGPLLQARHGLHQVHQQEVHEDLQVRVGLGLCLPSALRIPVLEDPVLRKIAKGEML